MKNHLKRIATPRTWVINRLSNTFITRPKPGAHPLSQGMALGVVLRDMIKIAGTMSEAKKILNNKEVLVDGKRRKDYRYIVGLFDVISLPEMKKQFRLSYNNKGKLLVHEISSEQAGIKVSRVMGKSVQPKGKIQLRLHDGRQLLSNDKVKVGDSLLIELPSYKIQKVLPLQKGAAVYLTSGKHAGDIGVLKELNGKEATYTRDDKDIETATRYLFVLGEKAAAIDLAHKK